MSNKVIHLFGHQKTQPVRVWEESEIEQTLTKDRLAILNPIGASFLNPYADPQHSQYNEGDFIELGDGVKAKYLEINLTKRGNRLVVRIGSLTVAVLCHRSSEAVIEGQLFEETSFASCTKHVSLTELLN